MITDLLANLGIAEPTPRPATSSRASSFVSSSGKVTPLRRRSSLATLIPETDVTLDSTLKGEVFTTSVLRVLIKLKLTDWKLKDAEKVMVKSIVSALTNCVYLVILDTHRFLLRIYGHNVLHLIDRDYETSVLARLAHHRIGPRLLGQFRNGRIEQWLESTEVTAKEIRDPTESRHIARRLREFHDYVTLLPKEMGRSVAMTNLDCWIPALPRVKLTLSVKTLIKHIDRYRQYLSQYEPDIVFCHNDIQYGNLLRVTGDEHKNLAVIDFEYAGPNPRAFDIANHFCEWMADYHTSPAYTLDPALYPTLQETNNFLSEYIRFGKLINRREDVIVFDHEVDALRKEVDQWRPMSHAMWSIWGIIQSLPAADKQDVVDQELKIKPRRKERDLVQGMRSPFLPPSSPRIKRVSSYKSPGYFATVMEHADDDFTLGESAVAHLSTVCTEKHKEEEWMDEDTFDYNAYSRERIQLFYGDVVRMGIIPRDEVPMEYEIRELPPHCFP